MRFSHVILALCGLGASASGALIGCGSSGTNGSGGSSSASSSSGSTGSGAPACAPKASCTAADKDCLGLVDNSGKTTFGLRMSEIVISTPAPLAAGVVATIVADAVTPLIPSCNISGSATFSWLIQFDTTAGTIKTGGAKPVTDPTMGYSFDDETVTQGSQMLHIQPVTFPATVDASGNFSVTSGMEIYVPIYLDAAASSVVILPLQQGRFTMGTLSASQNCIGSYNAAGLLASNSCKPNGTIPLFLTGGQLDGIITLEDADTIVVTTLNESLCVLLTSDPGMKDANGVTVCTRDASGKISKPGDACSTSGGTCTDAIALSAKFAASSVQINN